MIQSDKWPALAANDVWLRERHADLRQFAADLVEQAGAMERARAPRGRRQFRGFKVFVCDLRQAYRTAGGKREYSQQRPDSTFGGEAVEFVLAVCEQVEEQIPAEAMPAREWRRNRVGEVLKQARGRELRGQRSKQRKGRKRT